MKPIVVVDTNVPLAANGVADVSDRCVERCVLEILSITSADEKRVAIDLGGLILEEYRHKLSLAGQPGVGDAFLKWVYDNQADIRRCDMVEITALDEEGRHARCGPGSRRMRRHSAPHSGGIASSSASGATRATPRATTLFPTGSWRSTSTSGPPVASYRAPYGRRCAARSGSRPCPSWRRAPSTGAG